MLTGIGDFCSGFKDDRQHRKCEQSHQRTAEIEMPRDRSDHVKQHVEHAERDDGHASAEGERKRVKTESTEERAEDASANEADEHHDHTAPASNPCVHILWFKQLTEQGKERSVDAERKCSHNQKHDERAIAEHLLEDFKQRRCLLSVAG